MSNMPLKNKEEISNLIAQETLIPPDAMNPNLFRMYYDCPCGGQHPLPTCNHILCAFPHKFFINCENNIVTLVNIKGLIKQTLVEEWSCELDSFLSVMEVHLGGDQNVENDRNEKKIKRDRSKSEDDKRDKNEKKNLKTETSDELLVEKYSNIKRSEEKNLREKTTIYAEKEFSPQQGGIQEAEKTSVLKWIVSGEKLSGEDAGKIIDNDPNSTIITILFLVILILILMFFVNL